MNKTLWILGVSCLLLSPLLAEDQYRDSDNDRSSSLTPTAPRPVNMANPKKPGWQAEPHGK